MVHVISHSQADSYLTCEMRHYYAHERPNADGSKGLEPVHYSDGLYRGIVGHLVLEHYYKKIKQYQTDGYRITEADLAGLAQEAINEVLPREIMANPDRTVLLTELILVLNAYFEHYRRDDLDWKILVVERDTRLRLDDDIEFAFTPDLIRMHRPTGKIILSDHKFLAKKYTPGEMAIFPQLAKYVGGYRRLGLHIDDAEYNIIRHGVPKSGYNAKDALWRPRLNLSPTRIDRALEDQRIVSLQINSYYPEGYEGRMADHPPIRSANSFNCGNCSFQGICAVDLEGRDNSVKLKYEFRPNSYGYKELV